MNGTRCVKTAPWFNQYRNTHEATELKEERGAWWYVAVTKLRIPNAKWKASCSNRWRCVANQVTNAYITQMAVWKVVMAAVRGNNAVVLSYCGVLICAYG